MSENRVHSLSPPFARAPTHVEEVLTSEFARGNDEAVPSCLSDFKSTSVGMSNCH